MFNTTPEHYCIAKYSLRFFEDKSLIDAKGALDTKTCQKFGTAVHHNFRRLTSSRTRNDWSHCQPRTNRTEKRLAQGHQHIWRMNDMTIRDTYLIHRMEECIESLGDAMIFYSLDENSRYWKAEAFEGDRDKTTFATHHETFRFKRISFDLKNAPSMFHWAVDVIIIQVKCQSALVYLRDIIVYCQLSNKHLGHLQNVLSPLRQAGMSIRLHKYFLFTNTVDHLGHVVRLGQLCVTSKTMDAVHGIKPPRLLETFIQRICKY